MKIREKKKSQQLKWTCKKFKSPLQCVGTWVIARDDFEEI
jgi:hypothetical protein